MKHPYIVSFALTILLSTPIFASPLTPPSSPSLILPNSTSPESLESRGIHCFRKLPSDLTPTVADCTIAIDKILAEPTLMTPRLWIVSRPHAAAAAWRYKSCLVDLGVWAPGAPDVRHEDRFTMWELVGKAQRIVQECFGRGRVGGRAEVGPKGIFQIMVKHPKEVP